MFSSLNVRRVAMNPLDSQQGTLRTPLAAPIEGRASVDYFTFRSPGRSVRIIIIVHQKYILDSAVVCMEVYSRRMAGYLKKKKIADGPKKILRDPTCQISKQACLSST